MTYNEKTVAVIHTAPSTINGLKGYFDELLPSLKTTNFLDETILPELNARGGVTPLVRYRFYTMIVNAAMTKPDAILCACSSVGGLLEESRELVEVPALRIDEPMIKEAVANANSIGVLAALSSTIEPTVACIRRYAAKAMDGKGKSVQLEEKLAEGAGELLAAGKTEEYLSLVAAQINGLLAKNELVLLAQASMAAATELLDEATRSRVYTSPKSGISALKEILCNTI